ncbi:beta-ketoacyl synthase chain length factor [Chitinibacteraceae bacterium HSL-7]
MRPIIGPLTYTVADWHAFAPGLPDKPAWLDWAASGHSTLPPGESTPVPGAIPPMLRRRAEYTGRLALTALSGLVQADLPLVFVSRHGDAERSSALLTELASDGAISPQAFSMAVHNATAGLWSIAHRQRSAITALAAGANGVQAALTEAWSQLADGANAVNVVFADAPLPACYSAFEDDDTGPYGIALTLTRGNAFSFEYAATATETAQPPAFIRHALGFGSSAFATGHLRVDRA